MTTYQLVSALKMLRQGFSDITRISNTSWKKVIKHYLVVKQLGGHSVIHSTVLIGRLFCVKFFSGYQNLGHKQNRQVPSI